MTQVPQRPIPVGLSTASVYPDDAADAFAAAARLGYDGVEVLVASDPVSQSVEALKRLSDHYAVPVLSVHAPFLLITQRVWGKDPWAKLVRSAEAAKALGAATVVVHPPFVWQRDYARAFETGIRELAERTGINFAVENMYPWRTGERELSVGRKMYAPHWDPTDQDYSHLTLDLSHTAFSRSDALRMVDDWGDRLAHLHLADGSGAAKDEHLVPGRGSQPCAEVLQRLAGRGFPGNVVLELNTRHSQGREHRDAELTTGLQYARRNLAAPASRSAGRARA